MTFEYSTRRQRGAGDRAEDDRSQGPRGEKDGLLDRFKDWLDSLLPEPTPQPVPVPVGPDRRPPPRR